MPVVTAAAKNIGVVVDIVVDVVVDFVVVVVVVAVVVFRTNLRDVYSVGELAASAEVVSE